MGKTIKKGFSLREMAIVIALIGIIVGGLAVHAARTLEYANVRRAVKEMQEIGAAAKRHYSDTGEWPSWPQFPSGDDYLVGFVLNLDNLDHWNGPYLEKWPDNPWSRLGLSSTPYEWDLDDVDGDGTRERVVELGLSNISQRRKDAISNMIDRIIDGGDGPCAGQWRSWTWGCPHWVLRPKLIVYDPDL